MHSPLLSKRYGILVATLLFAVAPFSLYAQTIQADAALSYGRVAPGEGLAVSVRLVKFENSGASDAVLIYDVSDALGNLVTEETETVAVETTATVTHTVRIPTYLLPGTYFLNVRVSYHGEESPARSSYSFLVEQKIFDIFIHDLIRYILIASGSVAAVLLVVIIFERLHHTRRARHDYANIPAGARIYYEILDDTIEEMRLAEGNSALSLAQKQQGLSVDGDGRVIRVEGEPSSVVANLIASYEATFGKYVNLCFEKNGQCRAIVRNSRKIG